MLVYIGSALMFPAFLVTAIAILAPRKQYRKLPFAKPNVRLNCNYALDREGDKFWLTAQQAGVSVGDRIEVAGDIYRVQWVDYYLDPSDMFIAQLVR